MLSGYRRRFSDEMPVNESAFQLELLRRIVQKNDSSRLRSVPRVRHSVSCLAEPSGDGFHLDWWWCPVVQRYRSCDEDETSDDDEIAEQEPGQRQALPVE